MPVRGIVLVAHGGKEVSTEPTTAVQLAVLRMVPVAYAIRRAVGASGAVVVRPRFRVQGWNGDEASPVNDLVEELDQIRGRFGAAPVVLVGHSMGARAALRAAGHPAVTAVAGLAPWVPRGEPVDQLAGRRVLLAHGSADHITRPADTWDYADRASAVGQVAALEVLGGDHPMIRRAPLWHDVAAEFALAALGLPPDGDGKLARTIEEATAKPGRKTL
jgi:pimeloyl-ACP methyl ester carboxylesterase